VGRESVDNSFFQEIVGSAISERPHPLIVHKFKTLWTFYEGNLILSLTRVGLADALDMLEQQSTSDEVGHRATTKEISRLFYVSLPPQTIKTLLIAPRIPYLRASGVASIILERSNQKYKDVIAYLKGLFPEFRTNTTEIAFRVTGTTIERSVCHILELPTELLVVIFTMVAQDHGASPSILRRVCSHWRVLVNNTPSLWSYLSIWEEDSSIKIRYFLAQSNPSKIHVGLLWCDACQNTLGTKDQNCCDCPDPTPLFEHPDRIQCLRLQLGWMHRLSSLNFPSVQTLTLFNGADPWYQPISSISLASLRFPTLKRLDIYAAGDGFVREHVSWGGGGAYRLLLSPCQFPPIQVLRLTADKAGHWTDIINACSQTLVSLMVGIFLNAMAAKHSIVHLPTLKSLALRYFREDAGNSDRMVHLSTPSLAYYCLESTLHPAPCCITFDSANIIQLRGSQIMPPLVWPHLRCLQIPCKDTLISRLDELGLCATVLPSLIRVEVLVCESSDLSVCFAISQRVHDLGIQMGRNIQFVSQSTWLEKLYGYDDEETVRLFPHI
jgi:hypothetical protein